MLECKGDRDGGWSGDGSGVDVCAADLSRIVASMQLSSRCGVCFPDVYAAEGGARSHVETGRPEGFASAVSEVQIYSVDHP